MQANPRQSSSRTSPKTGRSGQPINYPKSLISQTKSSTIHGPSRVGKNLQCRQDPPLPKKLILSPPTSPLGGFIKVVGLGTMQDKSTTWINEISTGRQLYQICRNNIQHNCENIGSESLLHNLLNLFSESATHLLQTNSK